MPKERGRGRRTVEPAPHWRPCRHCGYCHDLEAWAAAHWHEQHDTSMGLMTYECQGPSKTEQL